MVKEWDAASPQFLQAMVTNEVLQNVTLQLSTVSGSGKSTASFKIVSTNGHVVDWQQNVSNANGVLTPTESVQFVYEKIEIEDLARKTAATDDWHTPA